MTSLAAPRQLYIFFSPDLAQKVHLGLKTETRRLVKKICAEHAADPTGRWTFCVSSTERTARDKWCYSVMDPNGHTRTERGMEQEILRLKSPYRPGDLLYVRENFQPFNLVSTEADEWESISKAWLEERATTLNEAHRLGYVDSVEYQGTGEERYGPWWPSIHMPKWAARTWLEVLSVSVERVQATTYGAAMNEGYFVKPKDLPDGGVGPYTAIEQFRDSWNARYPGSWDRNEWVFVYKFRKVGPPQ